MSGKGPSATRRARRKISKSRKQSRLAQKEAQKNNTPQKMVVVAGMGPGGLTAAIESAKKGYSVVIVEPRKYFTRTQTVGMSIDCYYYLKSFIEDERDEQFILNKIGTGPNFPVHVNDVQKYLTDKLAQFSNVEIVLGNITAINPGFQTVTITTEDNQTEVHFDHLVAADGARHQMADLVNKSIEPESRIDYQRLQYQPRHPSSGSVSLELDKEITPKEVRGNVVSFKAENLGKLHQMGWDKPYFPRVYILSRVPEPGKNLKYFVCGEIPDKIANMTDKKAQREALIEWGKFAVNVKYGYPQETISFREKPINEQRNDPGYISKVEEVNRNKSSSFQFSLSYASNSILLMGEGGEMVLLGDANKDANFYYSHGLTDAMLEGMAFAEALGNPEENTFSAEDFFAQQKGSMMTLENLMLRDSAFMPKMTPIEKLELDKKSTLDFAQSIGDEKLYQEITQKIKDLPFFDPEVPFDVQNYYQTYVMLQETLGSLSEHIVRRKQQQENKTEKGLHFSQGADIEKKHQELLVLERNVFSHFNNFYVVKEPQQRLEQETKHKPSLKS